MAQQSAGAGHKRLRQIDSHSHIIPRQLPKFKDKFGYGGFIELDHYKQGRARMMMDGTFFREIKSNCWDEEERIEEYDSYGVDVQVVCPIPVMFCYWAKPEHTLEVARFLNDHLAEVVQQYPKHYVGLGTIPLQEPDLANREMERCIEELGLAGVEIGSHVNDWNLNASQLFPFFREAERLGASILVHPWDMMGKEKMQDYWLPWLVGMPAETSLAICSMIFGGVFEHFPELRVLFSHGGGSFPATIGRIEHGFNVRPDLCAVDNDVNPKEYLGKFYIDSIVHDSRMLEYVVELMGADKVCMGTDYPFPLGELEPGHVVDHANLTEEQKSQIRYKSTLDWLGMKEEDFLDA